MPFCSLSAMEVKIRIGEEKGAQESQVGGLPEPVCPALGRDWHGCAGLQRRLP